VPELVPVMMLSHYLLYTYNLILFLMVPEGSCCLRWSWLQIDFSDSWAWGIGFWVWAATILYPSS